MATPQWIDTAFVQEVFNKNGEKELEVEKISVRPAAAVGDYYLSCIYRVTVTLSGGETRSLIVKCPLDGGHVETLARESGYYENEAHMYSSIVPALEELFKSTPLIPSVPFIPKCLNVVGETLVMEDLASEGFRLADKQKGQDFDHASLVLRTLARFHGASIFLLGHNADLITVLKSPLKSPNARAFSMTVSNNITEMAEEVRSWRDFPGGQRLAKKLQTAAPKVFQKCKEVLDADAGGLNVACHNDLWTSNMLFRYDEGEVREVRFIDLQLSCVTSLAADLILYRQASLDMDAWRRWPSLLEAYQKELEHVLKVIGGPPAPTLRHIEEEMHRCRCWNLLVIAIWLHISRADPGNKFDIDAALDGNGNYKAMLSDEYRRWLKMLLVHFDETGVFDDLACESK